MSSTPWSPPSQAIKPSYFASELSVSQDGKFIRVVHKQGENDEKSQLRFEYFRTKGLLLPQLGEETEKDSGHGTTKHKISREGSNFQETSPPYNEVLHAGGIKRQVSLTEEMEEMGIAFSSPVMKSHENTCERRFHFDPSEVADIHLRQPFSYRVGSPVPKRENHEEEWRKQLKERTSKNAVGSNVESHPKSDCKVLLAARGA